MSGKIEIRTRTYTSARTSAEAREAAQKVIQEAILAWDHYPPDMPVPRVSFEKSRQYVTAEEIQKHTLDRVHVDVDLAESEETGVVCSSCGAKERRQKRGAIATTLHADDCRRVLDAWAGRRSCACGANVGQRCAETCPDMLKRRAEWERTHCGARPTGRVISRFCALDGHGIETHGTDPCGGERCRLDKGHAGDHKDYDSGMQWPRSPVEERRAREAALVALVAAVPEGLDPVGWRAAVLAVEEHARVKGGRVPEYRASELTWALTARFKYRTVADAGDRLPDLAAAVRAYERALSPAPKVQPERRSRGPVVVVDRGEDE